MSHKLGALVCLPQRSIAFNSITAQASVTPPPPEFDYRAKVAGSLQFVKQHHPQLADLATEGQRSGRLLCSDMVPCDGRHEHGCGPERCLTTDSSACVVSCRFPRGRPASSVVCGTSHRWLQGAGGDIDPWHSTFEREVGARCGAACCGCATPECGRGALPQPGRHHVRGP